MRPQCQADRPRSGMQGEMRDQVRRRAPDALGHEAAQGDGQVGPAQISRRGHDAPALESIRVRAHGLDRREDRGRPGNRLLVGIAEQRRRHPPPPVRNRARLLAQCRHVAGRHPEQAHDPSTSPARIGPAASPALDENRSIVRSVTLKGLPVGQRLAFPITIKWKIRQLARSTHNTSAMADRSGNCGRCLRKRLERTTLALESIFRIMLFSIALSGERRPRTDE